MANESDEHEETLNVDVSSKGYVRIAKFNDKLIKSGGFVIGWYVSIPNRGSFYNSVNRENHLAYQTMNKLAIAVVVYPEKFLESNFLFRLLLQVVMG